jgi:hypothetical protein
MCFRGTLCKEASVFFFEKKEAKNFCPFRRVLDATRASSGKSFFGSFFSKKELLALFLGT